MSATPLSSQLGWMALKVGTAAVQQSTRWTDISRQIETFVTLLCYFNAGWTIGNLNITHPQMDGNFESILIVPIQTSGGQYEERCW